VQVGAGEGGEQEGDKGTGEGILTGFTGFFRIYRIGKKGGGEREGMFNIQQSVRGVKARKVSIFLGVG
jgi:hypothetical protein